MKKGTQDVLTEQKPDVKQDIEEQAVASVVEESSDTTNEQQSPEVDIPVAGEQETVETETSPEAEQPAADVQAGADEGDGTAETETEQAKTERKSRTAKRIGALLDEKKQLQEQLRAALSAQAEQPTQPSPLTGDSGQQPQDTPEYWASLYHQETDEAKRSQYAQRYEAAREKRIEDRAVARLRQEQQAKQQINLLVDELTDLHEVAPIFKPGTTEIDPQSALVRTAQAQAASRGQRITNLSELLFWGNKAARQLILQGGIRAQVQAKKTETKLKQTIAKTGLEGTSRSAAPKGAQDVATRMKSLREKAVRGDIGAAQELTRLQLAGHLA